MNEVNEDIRVWSDMYIMKKTQESRDYMGHFVVEGHFNMSGFFLVKVKDVMFSLTEQYKLLLNEGMRGK